MDRPAGDELEERVSRKAERISEIMCEFARNNKVQASCYHQLVPFKSINPDGDYKDAQGYRYICITCGKRLKLHSGIMRGDVKAIDKARKIVELSSAACTVKEYRKIVKE